jgi:trans-AT polyketide synthase, acyltransferase and oxidoreductase domains
MQQEADLTPVGAWVSGDVAPAFSPPDVLALIDRIREPIHVVREGPGGRVGVALGGVVHGGPAASGPGRLGLLATLPALYPEWLGDRSFCEAHGVRFPYATGAMANGIATTAMVIEMARAGMLGFFGAAGLAPARVARALDEIEAAIGGSGLAWGSNLIHSPNEPDLEDAVVDLYLARGVTHICASAYMDLTPSVVRYGLSGLQATPEGRIERRNHIFAKISRAEVARRFLSPAPAAMVAALLASGKITAAEAALAARVPLAEDITVEADSGGHTDNRPLPALFPTIRALAEAMAAEHRYTRPVRVGAAGGLGTPQAVAAAFAMGASYVLTGSINQAAVESGLSVEGRRLLAQADLADVIMAPAADMFELGVKLQVLRRGTLFAQRAGLLWELYEAHGSLDELPAATRAQLESTLFKASLADVWADTARFWSQRDAREVTRAESDPKHRMALVFRWYLGKSSRWAIDGDPSRRLDYQIWCGPAQGAFNAWVKGSFLEPIEGRGVVQIARNLLEGAAVVTRAQQLRSCGVAVPQPAFQFAPRPLA